MPYVLIRHNVADYPKWKRAFDGHGRAEEVGRIQGRAVVSERSQTEGRLHPVTLE